MKNDDLICLSNVLSFSAAFIHRYQIIDLYVTTSSAVKVFWIFKEKTLTLKCTTWLNWDQIKLGPAIKEIESSVFCCLYCPTGVLQFSLQLKWSVLRSEAIRIALEKTRQTNKQKYMWLAARWNNQGVMIYDRHKSYSVTDHLGK